MPFVSLVYRQSDVEFLMLRLVLQIYENYSEITPKQVNVSFNNGVNLWIPISFK